MRNSQRWIVSLGLGFAGGVIAAALDPQVHSWFELVRHGLIGLGPAVMSLKMTLNQDESTAKADAAGAGK